VTLFQPLLPHQQSLVMKGPRFESARWLPLLRELARASGQLTAFFTSAAIFFSSAAFSFMTANAVAHMSPSSRFAVSLKPKVAYLASNLLAFWKKQTTCPPWRTRASRTTSSA
jgi:hypothetical protein